MKLEFLYATDLHGNIKKYDHILSIAKEHNIKLIHLGADLLPKGNGLLKIQKEFIKHYLKSFYQECELNQIEVLAFFGNDDCYTRKPYFKEYAKLLDEQPYEKEGYIFEAYGYVPDYPFPLKTACKLDSQEWQRPFQTCPAKTVTDKGIIDIENVEEYFTQRSTIEEDLKQFHGGQNKIMAFHCPPYGLGLDTCHNGQRVGSQSVYNWIEREKPLLTLCGHIHESVEITNIWKAQIDDSIIIQPGQDDDKTSLVYIEIEDDKVKAQRI
jgi:uncharacterized protein